MKLLAITVFALILVAASAKPSGWWGGPVVDPGATVVGPSGSIHVGPSSAGAVIPGAPWHGVWGWGPWGHGAWGHHGLWW